jgi:hypothetical protein
VAAVVAYQEEPVVLLLVHQDITLAVMLIITNVNAGNPKNVKN